MTTAQYNNCVDLFSDGVYRFILHNIRDKDEAKDIVQDTFEKLWKNCEAVDFTKAKSYIFTTAHHTMIDKIRKNKRISRMEEGMEDMQYHEEQYSDVQEHVQRALTKLPEAQRSVILLRDFEGYDYREIGQITGFTESQVKVYIYRGRMFLKEYLGSLQNVL